MAATFATSDSPPVRIFLTDEGEDIRGNVYEFRIGFCTHDCPVLAFANVDAIKIDFGTQLGTGWTVRSDTGMELKLVTGSMAFATIEEAIAAERRLAAALAHSIEGAAQSGTAGITLEQMRSRWCDPLDPFAVELRSLCSQGAGSAQFVSWQDVGKQLKRQNIDNGMNVSSALRRYAGNAQDWEQYVGSTVVCRKWPDGGRGYIEQVNMPMTLAGYFLHMARVRLPQTDTGMEEATEGKPNGGAGDEQRVTDWFWNSLMASACNNYMLRVFGLETLVKRGTATDIRDMDPSTMSYNNLRAVALLYLIANKALSGGLAALSDCAHTKQQRNAWRQARGSAPGEAGTSDESMDEASREGRIDSPEWAEYHASLMGLTGAWFRAALQEVLGCEEFTPGFCRAVAFELRNDNEISIWHSTLKRLLLMLEEPRWDGLFADRKGTWDDLREHRWKPVVIQIANVERAIAGELETFAEWREQNTDAPGWEYSWRMGLADRQGNEAAAPRWEARPETLAAAIPNEEIDAWTYMVERRIERTPNIPQKGEA